MRGADGQQAGMFTDVSPERRIPADHPLRPIREEMTDTVLRQLSPRFAWLYPRLVRQMGSPLGGSGEAAAAFVRACDRRITGDREPRARACVRGY